ncbi:hypothetical protein DFH06DRAFT_1303551 [Mycena polygramma]|nr:hypothetical protein DFH06DRAFT_1303551 [Mycena polygramma]
MYLVRERPRQWRYSWPALSNTSVARGLQQPPEAETQQWVEDADRTDADQRTDEREGWGASVGLEVSVGEVSMVEEFPCKDGDPRAALTLRRGLMNLTTLKASSKHNWEIILR